MEKLTIVINGLEYVAKDNQINELERDMMLCSLEDERKQLIINELEERIEELEDVIQSIRYETDRV